MTFACKLLLSAVAVAAMLGVTAASAQDTGKNYDYCVSCTAPIATYVCTVGPGQPDPGSRVWAGFCGEKVRQSGGHQACKSSALTDACKPSRVYVYRGLVADQEQAENVLSEEPEVRAQATSGILTNTVETLRETGRQINDGARAVGRTVVEGVGAAGESAQSASDAVVDGARSVGRNISRGVDCVISLGQSC
ncbi:MAG: hypothetical protein ACC634_04330 [Hyphomicrobiales bacterium]